MSGTVEVLLTPAPVKEYIKGESRLEHGSRIVMAKRQNRIARSFPTVPDRGRRKEDFLHKYMSFVDELYKGNIALHIPELDKTFSLAYLSCGKYGSYGDCRAKTGSQVLGGNPG